MGTLQRIARVLGATALLTAVGIGFAGSAAAAATASIVDNGNGTATLTYSGVAFGDNVVVLGLPSGTPCTTAISPGDATFFVSSDAQAPGGAMPPSPLTIETGLAAFSVSPSPGPVTIAAGTYNLCIHNVVAGNPMVVTVLDELEMTLGAVAPTTTTTSTTAPAADPVAPAFTG
jgi:hypothetical protein